VIRSTARRRLVAGARAHCWGARQPCAARAPG